jgi:DNA-directed RNA polymerase specialized sigma24 family protein
MEDREETSEAPRFDELLLQVEREQIVREGILVLSERCRRLIRMLFFEFPPVPYATVAEKLGLARGSIGFIRGRCLSRLRRLLEDKGFES